MRTALLDFLDSDWFPVLILLTGISMICLVGYAKIQQANTPYDVVTASGAEYNHVYVIGRWNNETEFQSEDGERIMVRESYTMKRVK